MHSAEPPDVRVNQAAAVIKKKLQSRERFVSGGIPEQGAGHAQVDDQVFPPERPNIRYLPRRDSPIIFARSARHRTRHRDLVAPDGCPDDDAGDGPPHDEGLQAVFDRLDFGQFRHQPISPQFWPVLISIFSGTDSFMAPGMISCTSCFMMSISSGGTSKTSSSCTCSVIMVFMPRFCHFAVQVDHGHLDDIGGGALHGHVDGHAFGSLAGQAVGRVDLGYIAPASQHGLHIAQGRGLPLGVLDIVLYARVALEIGADEKLRLLPGEVGGLLQAVAAHAVDNAEIDGLGGAAHLGGDLGIGTPKTSEAVCVWTSSSRWKVAISSASCDMCASARRSICE